MPTLPVTIWRTRFERLLEAIVLVLVGALAVVVVMGVGFRKFGAALVWYDEVASILLAWLTYYGAALAALKRAHIGFPKPGAPTGAALGGSRSWSPGGGGDRVLPDSRHGAGWRGW